MNIEIIKYGELKIMKLIFINITRIPIDWTFWLNF